MLPRHTKVVVTGNNRTKSVLVGLHGVVKKAVGLGGWHWLVISFFSLVDAGNQFFAFSVVCVSVKQLVQSVPDAILFDQFQLY